MHLLSGGRVRVGASLAGEGRGLFACFAFKQGELVFEEPTFVAALGPYAYEAHCHACLSPEPDDEELSRCARCRFAHWCSRCSPDMSHSADECASLQALCYSTLDAPVRTLLAARLSRSLRCEEHTPQRHAQASLASTLVGPSASFPARVQRDLDEAQPLASSLAGASLEQTITSLAQLVRNEFRIQDERGVVLGSALYPLAARLNHACEGNLVPCRDAETRGGAWALRMEAAKDISDGEELLFPYITSDEERRSRVLDEQYLFTCACTACKAAIAD